MTEESNKKLFNVINSLVVIIVLLSIAIGFISYKQDLNSREEETIVLLIKQLEETQNFIQEDYEKLVLRVEILEKNLFKRQPK